MLGEELGVSCTDSEVTTTNAHDGGEGGGRGAIVQSRKLVETGGRGQGGAIIHCNYYQHISRTVEIPYQGWKPTIS